MPDGTGTGAKKETVYSGPALDNKQFAGGTVYQGPGQAAAQTQTLLRARLQVWLRPGCMPPPTGFTGSPAYRR